MKNVDEGAGGTFRPRQAQLFLVTPLSEVFEAILTLLLLHQGAMAGAGEALGAVQFHVLSVGEDNGLPRVHLRGLVGIAPQDIEATMAVHPRHPAPGYSEDFLQQGFQDHAFHFRQELFCGDLFAVGVFHPGEPGGRP